MELWLIVLLIFLLTVLLIVTRIVHYTTAAVTGAVLASIALISQGVPGDVLLGMIHLEPILIIAGMTVVAEVMRGVGVFQFLAMHFIRLTRGDPKKLFVLFCLFAAGLSTVLSNTVVILLMGYLTILTCQALKLEPHAFLIGELLAVGAGGAFTLIGSSSNVIVADYAGFDFLYYILRFWGLLLVVLIVTLVATFFFFRSQLTPRDMGALERVMDFEPWMMVPDRRLFWVCAGLFGVLIVAFVVFPQAYVVALGGMMMFMLVSHADPRTSLRDIGWDIIFFIGGLYVLSGCLAYVGLVKVASDGILLVSGGQLVSTSLIIMWVTWLGASVIGGSPMATT